MLTERRDAESGSSAGYWCPADESTSAEPAPMLGGSEWVALLKVASCDWTIEAADLACLLERKLIEKRAGVLVLTEQGRIALGIPV